VIDEHAQAFLDLLDADNNAPALVIHDGRVPSPTPPPGANPYVVAYFDDTRLDRDFRARGQTYQVRGTFHCVGGNAKAARMVADRVRAALEDIAPPVAGRQCWPITNEDDGAEPLPTEVTGTQVVDYVSRYVLRSISA
jgi:hypothetical protein